MNEVIATGTVYDEEGIFVNLQSCARCEKDHTALFFQELYNATDEFRLYAICPDSKQPVLLSMREI